MAGATQPTDSEQREAAPVPPATARAQWLAPLTGVVSVLAVAAGIVVLEGPADRPHGPAGAISLMAVAICRR